MRRFPEFDLGNFILREIIPHKDAAEFLAYVNRSEVQEFVPDSEVPKNLAEAVQELEYWRRLFTYHQSIFWAIAEKETDKFVGMAGCNSFSQIHRRAEISYDLNYEYWGRGIMYNALSIVNSCLQKDFGAIRIQATVATDNYRSIRLLEKLGFHKEGEMSKYGKLGDRNRNYYMYGLV